MHFHPDTVLPIIQLECAGPVGKAEVPMTAAAQPRELALASYDETAPLALLERSTSGELEIDLEHLILLRFAHECTDRGEVRVGLLEHRRM